MNFLGPLCLGTESYGWTNTSFCIQEKNANFFLGQLILAKHGGESNVYIGFDFFFHDLFDHSLTIIC